MPQIGPIHLRSAGEGYLHPARINAILWVGSTTAGDVAELQCPVSGTLLWRGQASDTNTYQGINLGRNGVQAPYGFTAALLPSGELLVYLREG